MKKASSQPFLYFQFANERDELQHLQFVDPIEIYSTYNILEVIPILHKVQDAVQAGFYAAGYVSYEAAPAFERAYKTYAKTKLPLVWFGIYKSPIVAEQPRATGAYTVSDWVPTTSKEQYDQAIHDIKAAIAGGDTYQTNYTIRLRSQFNGDDVAFFQRLSEAQRADYAAYLNIGQYRILSASPELFFRKTNSKIITRPMKGTIKRGRTLQEDQINREILYQSAKERAENVMIVDLLRNDLSRIALPGTVKVPKLFTIETYPTVLQMTSTVQAEVPDDLTIVDLFASLFPCGSITGAPKISTMEIIHKLETDPREVYCGAIGFIEPNGNTVFNVAIRTVVIDKLSGIAEYGVGGGITWDSTAKGEYDEVLTKAKLLTANVDHFELLETIKLERGTYYLFEKHIDRIMSSAQYFQFPIDRGALVKCLNEFAKKYPDCMLKVRLLVSEDGNIRLEANELDKGSDLPKCVMLANEPVTSSNIFLFHKTTHRKVYEQHRNVTNEVFDVLLWNEKGELTEFTTGNVVVELEGKRFTPPVQSGLLAGTFRAKLLEEGIIQERVLTLEDYHNCEKLWLINSVREWVPVTKLR